MTPGVTYGDPTPTIQPGGRPRGAMFMDPVGPSREMPGASSFMDPVAPKDSDVTQLATKPGRQILPRETETINANGVVQKGRDLSGGVSAAFVPEYANSSFNDLLAAQGTTQYNSFSSNQLPTTGANPFEGTAAKTQAFNAKAPGITGAAYDNYGANGGVAAASSTDRSQFTPMSGKEERVEGASERPKGGRLDAALADKAGINSYMSKFSSGDRKRAANRAFLDTEGSMEALRAKEAVNGVVYAQQQHYVAGSDADGPAQKITRDEARDISNGRSTAAGLLEAYKSRITEAQKDTPAEAQDPLSAAGSAVKSGFAAGAKTDFNLNNGQGKPQVGVGPVVKPEVVENADLTGKKGEEYLRKLDAGELF